MRKSKTKKISFFKQFFLMLKLIKKTSPGLFLVTILDIIVSATAAFPTILYPKYIIDALVTDECLEVVLILIFKMVAFSIGFSIMSVLLNTWRDFLSLKMGFILSNGVRKQSLNLDYDMFDNIDILDKQYFAFKVTDDNNFVSLLNSIRNFFVNLIILLGIVALTISVDFKILFVAIGVIILQTIFTSKSTKASLKYNEEGIPYMRRSEYITRIATRPFYRKDIILYNAKEYIIDKADSYNSFIFRYFKRLKRTQSATGLLDRLVSNLYNLFLYVFLAVCVISKTITVGDFSMYLSALNRFVSSCTGVVNSVISMRQKIQYFSYYDDFMGLKSKYSTGTMCLPEVISNESYTIKFENVYFKYPGCDTYVLENINFTIKSGEKLALVGANGAGKSTLILLLMRLYEPTKGSILLNGVDIKCIDYNEYISLFSSVFQDFNLFGYPVVENITFKEKNDSKSLEKVDYLIKSNGLHERISKMPNGINTYLTREIDPYGEKLSGGEGQKIAIIRSLYKDSKIIVLDEPTSALDPNAENEIYKKFSEMTSGKTAVFISHRLASTRFCDNVIMLEQGKIIEKGTHYELMDKKGKYYEMFSIQMKLYSE